MRQRDQSTGEALPGATDGLGPRCLGALWALEGAADVCVEVSDIEVLMDVLQRQLRYVGRM